MKKILSYLIAIMLILALIQYQPIYADNLTGITLDESHILMLDHGNVRDYHRLSVTGSPGDVTPEVEWQSSNPSVADVDDTGLVRAYSGGEAVITATTTDGRHSASCRVTVLPVTKERIRSRWERYKPVFDYDPTRTYTECLKYCYEEPPSLKAPYKAGKLDPVFEQDALNMANFVRFLAGLPDDLEICEQEAIWSQHGAVLIAVSEFSHFPPKPDDMDDDFYLKGSIGAAGNLSLGRGSPYQAIKYGWMPDICLDNMRHVGHRVGILGTALKYTGFGFVGGTGYSVMSVLDRSREETMDLDYKAWPNSDWFPVEFFSSRVGLWSVTFSHGYQRPELEDVEVVLTRLSDNRRWVFNESHNDVSFNDRYLNVAPGRGGTIIFRPEGIDEYSGSYHVKISGLSPRMGNPDQIEYTVNFFSLDEVDFTPVTAVKLSHSTLNLNAGESVTLQPTVSPSKASDKSVIYSSSNTLVATVNTSGRVTAVGPGEANIKVVTRDGKETALCRLTVKYVPLESISLSDTDIYLQGVRSKLRMPAQYYPSNASNKQLEWSSDNEEVVTVSPSGVLTAIAPGEANITARSVHYEHVTASCTVTVEDDGIYYGDVNGDGYINVSDAIQVLRHIVGLTEIEQERLTAADVTGSGSITVTDAILILRYIVGLY